MSVVGFALELAGDVSSFTPSVRTEMQGAIAARAGVDPSAVTVTVTSGSVIVLVSIQTYAVTATSVQSTMASATSSPSGATAMLASVTGVSIAVLAVVTPPTIANVAPPPPPPPSSLSPFPPPQQPPGAQDSAGGGAITILAIAVPAAIVGLLCCLAMVCWWSRRRGVELRRKDVNNWLRNTSASTVSAEQLCQQEPPVSIPSVSGGGGGGGGGVGIEMSDRFDRYSSETKGSARADRAAGSARHQDMARQRKEEAHCVAAARSAREGATIVHQPPWGRSSACSAADLSVVTDSHDYHVDAGKHQLSNYELRMEGEEGRGDGVGNGGVGFI